VAKGLINQTLNSLMVVDSSRTAFELIVSLENVIRIVQGEYAASVEAALVEYRIYDNIRGDMTGE
jgi:hypothetical protein